MSHLTPDLYDQTIATRECVVAEADGSIVGLGQLNREKGMVEAVYVLPDRAGAGIGASLLNTLEASARAAGIELLRVDASLNSVGFYEHMGYEVERQGIHRTGGGREVRCIHMSKDLTR